MAVQLGGPTNLLDSWHGKEVKFWNAHPKNNTFKG